MSLDHYFKAIIDGDLDTVKSYETLPIIQTILDQPLLDNYNKYFKSGRFNYHNITAEHRGAVLACYEGNFNIVKYFYNKGIPLIGGNEACFRWACFNNQYDVAKFLIDKGANIYAKESEAFQEAEQGNNKKILNLLNPIETQNMQLINMFLDNIPRVSLETYLDTMEHKCGLKFTGLKSLDILIKLNNTDWSYISQKLYQTQDNQVLSMLNEYPTDIENWEWMENIIKNYVEFDKYYPRIFIEYQKRMISKLVQENQELKENCKK